MIFLMKMPLLAILAHFWPVFGLLWPWYQCPKLSRSIFNFVLTGFNEIGKKILNNNDFFDKNADFGHFSPLLACYGPGISFQSSQGVYLT